MIQLIFTNTSPDVEPSPTITLKHVRSVTWVSEAAPDNFISGSLRVGALQRKITVNGFLNKTVYSNSDMAAQQQLETDLRAVGTGTLSYTDATDFTNVRFLSLSFAEYRGNPIAEFTIEFVTEITNIQAWDDCKIGNILLTPANGYEQPLVRDVLSAQHEGEQLLNTRSRKFIIEGNFVAATLDAIVVAQAALVAAVENKDTIVITLGSTSSAPGAYTVATSTLTFGSPKALNGKMARSYRYEGSTYDNYSKEPYTLGETAETYASISIDVTDTVKHTRETELDSSGGSGTYNTTAEQLIVTGKKYFDGWSSYTTFRDLFRPVPVGTYQFVSATTSNTLELIDADIGEMSRDARFPGGSNPDSKRYSAKVSLTFDWLKSVQMTSFESGTTHFGVTWHKIENVSFNMAIDSFGNITSRSVSVSGQVLGDANFDVLKGKVGTKVDYDTPYNNLFVTSVSSSSVETVHIGAGGAGNTRIHTVNVSANQLDTASQAFSFLSGVFQFNNAGGGGRTGGGSAAGQQILFDNVTSRGKSISNRYDSTLDMFKVTSISMNCSGEVFSNDSGAGKPADASKLITLFNKIDGTLAASRVQEPAGGVVFSADTTNVLPTNVNFMLTNINIGGWTPFVDQTTGVRRWKTTVSLSAQLVIDLSGGGGGSGAADVVETRSDSIQLEAPKYTTIQILGFGTKFKMIGTTPERLVVNYQVTWGNASLYKEDNVSGLNFKTDDVDEGSWRGKGKNVKTKENKTNQGLTNRHTVEYTANEQLG
ncbi:MAG: hypothetical protein CMB80_11010 [Flammeovirgaceae bacterium]|nr:hypothetical protein [Flammeovirgaceae bacterium]